MMVPRDGGCGPGTADSLLGIIEMVGHDSAGELWPQDRHAVLASISPGEDWPPRPTRPRQASGPPQVSTMPSSSGHRKMLIVLLLAPVAPHTFPTSGSSQDPRPGLCREKLLEPSRPAPHRRDCEYAWGLRYLV